MEMTITRALVTLKRLNSQIDGAIRSGKYVARLVGKNQFCKVAGHVDTVASMTAKIQGSFDSVDSLITNREKIKAAIVLSNANTQVSVLGRLMTVAEAIELKSTVEFRSTYVNVLRMQLANVMTEIEKHNDVMNSTIEVSMNAIYGSEKSKVSEDSYKLVANPQKEQKESSMLDPAGIEAKIEKILKEILDLSSELDFTLSESNAKTIITV